MSLKPLDEKKIWIDFISYADRLFSGGKHDLWSNPNTFISIYSQGQGLIRSDVLGIPVGEVYEDLLEREEEIYKVWVGKKPTYALKNLLRLEEPKQYLIEVLSGIQNLYQDSIPIALVIPSPETWIRSIHEKINPNEDLEMTERLIESVSMYLAEFLRSFSKLSISAIVIKREEKCNSSNILLYEPMINMAQHYKWLVGLELQGIDNELGEKVDKIDFCLIRESSFTTIQSIEDRGDLIVGGGLDTDFWMNNEKTENAPEGLTYGEIPKNAQPERVLSQLETLRA